MRVQVYYEDTDVGGVVYHANYLKYCERARSQVFFDRHISPILENGHFVARKVVADYFKGARLGDLLEVKTELLGMKSASFSLKQTIYKASQKIFEMEILLAYVDHNGKVQKLDTSTKELILSLF